MLPKGVNPHDPAAVAAAKAQHDDLAAQVKKEFAGKEHTGEQVTHAIQKRWAEKCGEPFNRPAPPGPIPPAQTATVRETKTRPVGRGHAATAFVGA